MIKQVGLNIAGVGGSLLERALVQQLSAFLGELQIDVFAGSPLQLQCELLQVELILGLARLHIHARQHVSNELDRSGDVGLVGVVVGGVLDHILQQKRVPCQPRGRFRQITVELQLPRLFQALRLVDELGEGRVGGALLLKLKLPIDLARAVLDERVEHGHELQEDVPNVPHDRILVLSPRQLLGHLTVHAMHLEAIRKHRSDELLSPMLGNGRRVGGIRRAQRLDPEISQVLEILDEVPFGVHDLTDDLLSLLLLLAHAVRNLLRHGIDPELLFIVLVPVQARARFLPLETRLQFQIQPRLLLQPPRTGDGITQSISRAGGRVAFGQQGEDAIHLGRVFHQRLSKLIEFLRRVPQSMIVRDIVKQLLGVEGPPQQQRKVPIGRLDDVRDQIDRLLAREGIFIGQLVLRPFADADPLAKRIRDTREQGWVDQRRPSLGRHHRRRSRRAARLLQRRPLFRRVRPVRGGDHGRGGGHGHRPRAHLARRPSIEGRRMCCSIGGVVDGRGALDRGALRFRLPSPVRNHSTAHGLAMIAIQRVRGHGHGPLVVPFGHNATLRRRPRHGGLVGMMSERARRRLRVAVGVDGRRSRHARHGS